MDYKAKECAVCGSDKIKLIHIKTTAKIFFIHIVAKLAAKCFQPKANT